MQSGAIRLARDALATSDLRRLQLANIATGVGGWAFMVSLAVHAYAVGGAAAVGLAALVRMVPAGLAAPLTGLAADRFSRRDVLLISVIARALLLAAAALIVALDAPFALLLVLATLFTVAATAHKPAQAALLPSLAPSTTRQAASNALWTAIDNGAFVAGAMAGGILVAAFGAATAFAAAGLSFAAAAIALAHITRAFTFTTTGCESEHSTRGLVACAGRDALAGVRVVARDRRLRLLVGVLSASTLVEGMVDVLVVVTALNLVAVGDAGVGWLNAAWGIGGIAGGAVALKLLASDRLAFSLPAGGMLIGAPLIALAVAPGAAFAFAAFLILGIGYALVESAGITLLQRIAHDRVRARAFGVIESSYWLTTGAGAMLAPAIIALTSPRAALAIVGAALPALVLARAAALTRLPEEHAHVAAHAHAPASAHVTAFAEHAHARAGGHVEHGPLPAGSHVAAFAEHPHAPAGGHPEHGHAPAHLAALAERA